MVNAILYVTLNALNVLCSVALTLIMNLLVFHLYFLFSYILPLGKTIIGKTNGNYTNDFQSGKDRNVVIYYI